MCIFCDIINHKQKADIVYKDEKLIAFKDISPKARIHLLILPKKHIESINNLEDKDKNLISRIIFLAKKLAIKNNIDKSGYKLLFNVGRGGGQIVDHLHLHLLGGGEYHE